jgi:hypothetical protein
MIRHRMQIARQLRAARTSALTAEERREALRAAERAATQKEDRPSPEADSPDDATPARRAE